MLQKFLIYSLNLCIFLFYILLKPKLVYGRSYLRFRLESFSCSLRMYSSRSLNSYSSSMASIKSVIKWRNPRHKCHCLEKKNTPDTLKNTVLSSSKFYFICELTNRKLLKVWYVALLGRIPFSVSSVFSFCCPSPLCWLLVFLSDQRMSAISPRGSPRSAPVAGNRRLLGTSACSAGTWHTTRAPSWY